MFASTLRTWTGDQLVELEALSPINGNPSVFDTLFRAKKLINKPGVYAIFFDDQLLYVGKYQGKKSDPFAGNVVGDRWAKHLATITCRGKIVSMGATTLRDARKELCNLASSTSLATSLHTCVDEVVTTDRGCVTTIPRIRFANSNWDSFTADISGCLRRFKFLYLPVLSNTSETSTEIRKNISDLEELLISILQPTLNVAGVSEPKADMSLSSRDYEGLIKRLIIQSKKPHVLNDDYLVGLSEEFFQSRNFGILLENSFLELINWLQYIDGVDYYFTDIPDFRIKTLVGKKRRVVATLKLIPSKRKIRLRTLSLINSPGLSVRRISDPLPYEYKIEIDSVKKNSIVQIVRKLLNSIN